MATDLAQSTAVHVPPAVAGALPRRRGHVLGSSRRALLGAADAVALLLAAAAAALVAELASGIALLAALPAWMAVAAAYGLYSADDDRAWHRTTDELGKLASVTTIFVALVALVAALAEIEATAPAGWIAIWLATFAWVALLRSGARAAGRALSPPARVLVIGDDEAVATIERKLLLERGHHLELAEAIDLTGDSQAHFAVRAAIVTERVDRVIVAAPSVDEDDLSRIAAHCRTNGTKLSVASFSPVLASVGTTLHHVAEIPFFEVRTAGPSSFQLGVKRAIDIVVGGVLALASLPLVAAIALAVRLGSRGPVFFRQQRCRERGRTFAMLKFRTMCDDAEQRLGELVVIEALANPMFKLERDPRVTRVGRFLRATSLDELPQIFNVVRGDMSLVGPRPEQVALVERYSEADRAVRLGMKPGMTGPMQVHGRGELTFDERIAVERDYVECYSLRKDVRILARTLSAVMFRNGAY